MTDYGTQEPYYTPQEFRAALIARGVDPDSADHLIEVCPELLEVDVDTEPLTPSNLHPEIWSLVMQVAKLCRWAHAYDLRLTLISPKTKGKVASYIVENPDRPMLIRVGRSDAAE